MKTSNHSSSDSERSDMSDISESEFGLIFISSFSTATSIIRSLLENSSSILLTCSMHFLQVSWSISSLFFLNKSSTSESLCSLFSDATVFFNPPNKFNGV